MARSPAAVELGDTERHFQLLLDAVSDFAIIMLDPNGVVASWNGGARRIKGFKPSEIIGQHFSIFYTPEDRLAGLPEKALAAAASEGRFEREGWRLRKDGSRFWANVVIEPVRDGAGDLVGFAKVTRDITERKEAEEALRASEERFRLLVSNVTDYAIYMVDPAGIVSSWNAGAERFKGYTEEEILGQHFSLFYTPEDRAAGLPAQALETAAREGRYEREGWRLRKDGTRFWASVIIDPIRDETGRLVGYAKITRDVTERKETEEALDRARAEAHQSQKMAAVAQLASGIAHDFNNLLTVVMGNLDLLKRAREERRDGLIGNALRAIEEARKLTGKLLAFSRRQPLYPEVLDLRDLIAGMEDMLSQSLRDNIRLELALADAVWPVEVDRSQLQIALINLAANARDAMPKGGVFRIAIRNTRIEDRDGVEIAVRDSGVGIPPEVLPQVFEPFFTTKPVGEGTGLGLAQVYGFAKQSGGSVSIRSEVGQGTTFTLHLPKSEAAPRPTAAKPEEHRAEGRPMRVLLVEDNSQVAEIATTLLAERGHAVIHATSGDEAIGWLQRGEAFDIVFSDLVMPGGMDGLDLARSVRARWPDLPILLATGYSEVAHRVSAEGFSLIAKPYRPEDLLEALGQARRPRPGSGRSAKVVRFPR